MYNHFDKADWKEFFLSDICNINSGVRLTKANVKDGNILFIGAQIQTTVSQFCFKHECLI